MFTHEKNYQDAIGILTSQGKFHINLGLERCQEILELLNNPERKLKYIHVAGTNGKGSVCAILSSILTSTGTKTGIFTSPHIFEYTERIKINNENISPEDFAALVIKVTKLADEHNIHLTEFEIITVAAFEYFAQNNVDIIILETGLGGRLDATNVIEKNICSIITNIDLDHTERLGDTIEKIATEKAGIIKPNCPVIINENNKGFNIIKTIANSQNAELITAKDAPNFLLEALSLKGKYQNENLALALDSIEVINKNGFNINQETITVGLKNVKHICRFEYLKNSNILIDGAHNPDGAKALRESLNKYFPCQNYKFIFGCLKNKNYQSMIKNLFTKNDEIYFYEFNNPNACTFNELAKVCDLNSKNFSEFKKDDSVLTVICGSFYMIKELLEKMGIK